MTQSPPQLADHCNRCGHDQPGGLDYCAHCGRPMYARPTGWHPRTWWRWTRWFLLHKVLHVDDTPHRIALGLAVGIFVAFTPTVGFQMALTVLLAWIVRANKVVGVPLAWITNPVTIPPIFYFNYRVGALIVGSAGRTMSDFAIREGPWWETVKAWWQVLVDVFWQCWLGSLIVATILGTATYFLSCWLVTVYRARHRRQFPGSRFDAQGRPVAGQAPNPQQAEGSPPAARS